MGKMDGQVAIVTGASRGIGHFMARELAKEGSNVVIAARSETVTDPKLPGTIYTVAEECRSYGVEALPLKVDVTSDDDVAHCVEQTLARFGRLDLLINNAGLLFPGPMLSIPVRRLDLTHRVNVRGPYLFTQAVLPHLLARGGGTVITISSTGADSNAVNNTVYAMSKVAIEKLMQGLAGEVGDKGVRCFGLKPSKLVVTPGASYWGIANAPETEPDDWMGRAAIWLATAPAAMAYNGGSFTSRHVLEELAAPRA